MPKQKEYELLVQKEPQIDAEFFDPYLKLEPYANEIYTKMKPSKEDLEKRKTDFYESGMTASPDLRPSMDAADLEKLDLVEQQLLDLKSEVVDTDDIDLARIYRLRINELIGNIRMLKASATGNSRAFELYNFYIYGKPDVKIFEATLDHFRGLAVDALGNSDANTRNAAQTVLDILPTGATKSDYLEPDLETFQRVKESHYAESTGRLALMFDGVDLPTEGKVPNEVGDKILRTGLDNIGLEHYDIVDGTGGWGMTHIPGAEAMKRPKAYNMPHRRFAGLPVHELVHGLERSNGLNQSVRLFGSGLDRTESGNEGRSVVFEQVPYDDFKAFSKTLRWRDIMRRHLSICLGEGYGAVEKRSFAEVYKIINAVDQLWYVSRSKDGDMDKARKTAHAKTWALTARTLKGTDGNGGSYRKDSVYLEGNVRVWAAEQETPGIIDQGDKGKFDVSNPRHIQDAKIFGVIE